MGEFVKGIIEFLIVCFFNVGKGFMIFFGFFYFIEFV